MDPIIIGLVVVLALNLFIFPISYYFQTDRLTDITYALSFASIAVYGFAMGLGIESTPKIIMAGLILLWAIRLGAFLFYRVTKMGKDDRFDEIRTNPMRFLRFFLIQAVSSWVISLPFLYYLLENPGTQTGWQEISIVEWAGIGIALTGLLVEAIADQQKAVFKADAGNKDKLLTSGLYGVVQYPNYLGEISFWIGIFIVAIPVLSGLRWLAILSPIIIILLLLFLSGIPTIEKARKKKFAGDKEYEAYSKETAKLIPGVY